MRGVRSPGVLSGSGALSILFETLASRIPSFPLLGREGWALDISQRFRKLSSVRAARPKLGSSRHWLYFFARQCEYEHCSERSRRCGGTTSDRQTRADRILLYMLARQSSHYVRLWGLYTTDEMERRLRQKVKRCGKQACANPCATSKGHGASQQSQWSWVATTGKVLAVM